MKKIITLVFILCICAIGGNLFGQEKKTQEKKGGFAVGGYDNTRQEKSTVTKRSVDIPAEAAPAEKAMEVEEAEAAQPSQAPAPAAADAKPQREAQENAYAKDKEKAKKNTKSKGKRR